MVSPGARRYMVKVCSASFSLSSCKPQKTQVLLRYGLLQMVYAIASPSVAPSPLGRGRGVRVREPERQVRGTLTLTLSQGERGLRAAKPQRIRHDGYRTERHGHSREHGIEQDAKRRVQKTSGNWNAHDVVDKCPEEVLFDRTHGAMRQIHGRRNPTHIAAHQGDIGCLHGHIGTGANSN